MLFWFSFQVKLILLQVNFEVFTWVSFFFSNCLEICYSSQMVLDCGCHVCLSDSACFSKKIFFLFIFFSFSLLHIFVSGLCYCCSIATWVQQLSCNNLVFNAMPCRDLVHRQTACSAIKHMALGVFGFGCEDALTHLLNYVWPNIFETSPHVINAVMEATEGCRVALGPVKLMQYCLQVCCLILFTLLHFFRLAVSIRDVFLFSTLFIFV